MGDSGQLLRQPEMVDGTSLGAADGVSVSAGNSSPAVGNAYDIGGNGSPQVTQLNYKFAVTDASSNNWNLEVYVRFSDDGSNWPDADQQTLVGVLSQDNGNNIGESKYFPVRPWGRYARLDFFETLGNDSLTVESEVTDALFQGV